MYLAFRDAVIERDRLSSWTNTEELLAAILDAINALRAELAVGIPTVSVRKLKHPQEIKPTERPEWVNGDDSGDVIVMRPRDLAKKMMNRKAS